MSYPPPELGEEARYVYYERLGIGDELGLDPVRAEAVARREASLVAVEDLPAASRAIVVEAIDLLGATVVGVRRKADGPLFPTEASLRPARSATPAEVRIEPEPEHAAPPRAAPSPAPRPSKPVTVSLYDAPPGLGVGVGVGQPR